MEKELLDALAEMVAQRITTKTVGNTANGTFGHGSGGVFSLFNMNQDVVNASVMPVEGLLSRIPFRASTLTHEKYGILTGFTGNAGPGTQSEDECGDCETAGLVKLCTFSTPFGRFCMDTPVYDVTRFGERTGRSEFMDYRLIGNPMSDTPGSVPEVPGAFNDILNNDIAKFLAEFVVGYQRSFSRKLLYTGNPANSIGNGRIEPRGLDILINKGYQDADTGVLCPAADSMVSSFANQNVSTSGAALVNELTYMFRYFKQLAQDARLTPVRWAFVMPPALFYEITAVWPCSYLTYRCAPDNSGVNNIDARDQIAMRSAMRQGSYLLIDDQQVEVIQDSTVVETYADGNYTAGIYIVPLTIVGNTPSLFGEFFNFNTPGGAAEAANLLGQAGDFKVTGGGRYFWTRERNGTCFKWKVVERPRIVLTTPFLAGRLTDIQYTPLIHERSWSPSDDWFYDGGLTSRGTTYLYPPTVYG